MLKDYLFQNLNILLSFKRGVITCDLFVSCLAWATIMSACSRSAWLLVTWGWHKGAVASPFPVYRLCWSWQHLGVRDGLPPPGLAPESLRWGQTRTRVYILFAPRLRSSLCSLTGQRNGGAWLRAGISLGPVVCWPHGPGEPSLVWSPGL